MPMSGLKGGRWLTIGWLSTVLVSTVLLALIASSVVEAQCKIEMTVRSMTATPFKFKVKIPAAHAETEDVIFTHKGQQKQVKVSGTTCMGKPWVFRTYKLGKHGHWKPAKQGTAKLHGMGKITVTIDDNLLPRVNHLFAVHCSESMICG